MPQRRRPFNAAELSNHTLSLLEREEINPPLPLVWSMREIASVLRCSTRVARRVVVEAGVGELRAGRWYATRAALRAHLPKLARLVEEGSAAWALRKDSVTSDKQPHEKRSADVISPNLYIGARRQRRGAVVEITDDWGRPVRLVPVAELADVWGWRPERVRRWLARNELLERRGGRYYARARLLHTFDEAHAEYVDSARRRAAALRKPRAMTIPEIARMYNLARWKVWDLRCFADSLGVKRRRVPGRVLVEAEDIQSKLLPALQDGTFELWLEKHRDPVGKLGFDPKQLNNRFVQRSSKPGFAQSRATHGERTR